MSTTHSTWIVISFFHVAGDKAFVDYSGDRLHLVDRQTGARVAVELFVGALGASNYTFADVTLTQRGPDFLASHVRMLEHFGGVPAAIVPDQLKSGVTRSCWYAPCRSARLASRGELAARRPHASPHQPTRADVLGVEHLGPLTRGRLGAPVLDPLTQFPL